MNPAANDMIDPAVGQELIKVFGLVDDWFVRSQQEQASPAPGSSLAGDDKASDPYPVSAAATSVLISAVNHIHAVRTLIVEAKKVHPNAPLTLLRGALENAATAVWLLAPKSRDTRVLRRLRLEYANAWNQEQARILTQAPGGRSLDERRQRLQDMARTRGLSPDQVSQVAARVVGFRAIVREAATDVPGRDPELAEFIWMVCSGIAHAQTWATIAASDLTRIGQASPTVSEVRLTTNDQYLLGAAQITAVMIRDGWQYYDRAVACHR